VSLNVARSTRNVRIADNASPARLPIRRRALVENDLHGHTDYHHCFFRGLLKAANPLHMSRKLLERARQQSMSRPTPPACPQSRGSPF
jgi:hypothetical protein